jgi:glucose-6-phosphate isomerase
VSTPQAPGPDPVTAAGVTVRTAGAGLLASRDRALDEAVSDGLAGQITAKVATLWGEEATAEARVRLGWLDAPQSSRALLPRLAELRRQLAAEGLDRIVLAGMGGSSLAPEVICRTAGVELTVLDTTDPGQVLTALEDRLERTLVVVSSKSGGTVETDSHRRAFAAAFEAAGVQDVGSRFVAVTDPGSPLEQTARDAGFREVFLADPDVGGRYSALTAFGLVPSALAGVDVARLLDDAAAASSTLSAPDGNPALVLGAALGGAAADGRDKMVLADTGSGIVGFGDWAEQLVAESTGKSGRGLLPVVVESPTAPGTQPAPDVHLVTIGDLPAGADGTAVSGPLGAQFLVWEYATAVAGRVLRIDPFNQPNVQESKDNTKALLDQAGDGPLPEGAPAFTDGPVAVYGDAALLGDAKDVAGALDALLASVPDRGYLAVLAYLDRFADAGAAQLRARLASRLPHPVTFGWGPRFLHSTGQYHKGGPAVGSFLQITGDNARDLEIAGRPYTFGLLQRAQALGDLGALAQRGRPTLRLHLIDRAAGLQSVITAAGG